MKNYVKFIQKNYFFQMFKFLLTFFQMFKFLLTFFTWPFYWPFFIDQLIHLLTLHVMSCVYNM